MSDVPRQLPPGWCRARLAELAQINPPNVVKPPADGQVVSFIPMAAVEERTGRLDPTWDRPWTEVKTGYTRFQDGDVLFAKITPCMENGKVALAHGLRGGVGAGSTEFHVLRPGPAIRSKFLVFLLLQEELRREARKRMTGTAGQLRVPAASLETLPLSLPPLPEQERVVATLESLLSRFDAAVAPLERVRRNIRRYRAAVLNAAVEGRVVPTEAELARAEGRDYEPADVLLKRVLADRRRRWEEVELARMTRAGKPPQDDRWRARYPEPALPDGLDLTSLPGGWRWASVDMVGEVLLGRQRAPQYLTGRFSRPYLRVANVKDDVLDLSDIATMDFDPEHFEKYRLTPGDILVSEGQSPELVGHIVSGRCRADQDRTSPSSSFERT